ncbi:MAG: hypothetical protein O3B84_00985 [Chloroflexi bacterium]|nr:hypothetical protein [Chloroflexota bacterium]
MERGPRRYTAPVLLGSAILAALSFAACAPAAPVDAQPAAATAPARAEATATPFDQSTFAPSLSATPSPLVIPTPARPPFQRPVLPPSMLEGGDRLPNADEIAEKLGLSEADARAKYVELRIEWNARAEVAGLIRRSPWRGGPDTAGNTYVINGKEVTLPDDVYLSSRVETRNEFGCVLDSLECAGMESPVYAFRRVGAIRGGVVRPVWVDSLGRIYIEADGWVLAPWPEGFEFLEPLRR